MPELPEVQTIVQTLRPRIVGHFVSAVNLNRRDILHTPAIDLAEQLTGRQITAIDRRAKKILIRLDSPATLIVHLGMSGRLTLESPDTPIQPHTHLIINLSPLATNNRQLATNLRFRDPRRFGGIWYLPDHSTPDENLGPEPLTLRSSQLARQLSRTTRAIKTALLDQSLIAGLGNIYADESLHLAGIHPTTPANRLSKNQSARLNRAIKLTLRQAIRSGGSSLRDYVDGNGESGAFQKLHRVYDRAGEACHGCGGVITRIVLGGRSTHFCAKCQRKTAQPDR